VIQVITVDTHTSEPASKDSLDDGQLPDWCNVYEGMSDDEIAELAKAILRRVDLTRPAT